MAGVEALPVDALRWQCDPDQFDFETTKDLEDLHEIIGQDRAVEAIEFGIGIDRHGYNMYALGPTGTGKQDVLERFIRKQATDEPTPPDVCYVYNFDEPKKPRTLVVPAGTAKDLSDDMDSLIEELIASIPAAFESDDFQTRRQAINEEFQEKQEKAFQEVQEKAEKQDIQILRTPSGVVLAPVKDGEVVPPGEFDQLDDEEREKVEEKIKELQKEFQQALQDAPKWERKRRKKLKELSEEVTRYAVKEPFDQLRENYQGHDDVQGHLDDVEEDVVENATYFIQAHHAQEGGAIQQLQEQQQQNPTAQQGGQQRQTPPQMDGGEVEFRRYKVNVIVDNADLEGAPVEYLDDPTLDKLTGKVEHIAQYGALITDFNLIEAGALHRANGGYLLLDARKLLMHGISWEQLKRSLQSEEIRIESARQILGMAQTVSLEPQPLDLDIKIVILGARRLYYMLSALDPEFDELFKVAADFSDDMDREQSVGDYARLIATFARHEELCCFDRSAVARIVERMARVAGDKEKMSTHMETVKDLLRESDYWAGQEDKNTVSAEDVDRAIEARIRRESRVRDRMLEQIERDTILIDTEGSVVGQVNGLSVLQLGNFAFGKPSRITASVRLGDGEVVDIEREADLGGPIHSKGVMIISGFLGSRFAQDHPLSLTASVVFEQSYGGVDGDSASLAEVCTIMSSLAEIPIDQRFAMTGSVNQNGRVQAIGGVNEKIEGFFDTCKDVGLTGDQGVLIPDANVKHLMLRQDIIDAVENGDFNIYAVRTVDEALTLLTGAEAGGRGDDGTYPEDSVNGRVAAKLLEFAESARKFRGDQDDE
jgi:lon-related putative ATP-dependent protease